MIKFDKWYDGLQNKTMICSSKETKNNNDIECYYRISEYIKEEIEELQNKIDKTKEYINKHCVNERVSKEVGYKCYTMADTQELEHIMKLLEGTK